MTQTSIKIRIKSPQSQSWEPETGPDLWVTPTRDAQPRRGGDRQLRTVVIVAILGVLALVLTGVAYIGLGGRSPRPIAALDEAPSNPEAGAGAQSSLELIDRSIPPEAAGPPPLSGTAEADTPGAPSQVVERPRVSERLEAAPQEMPAETLTQQPETAGPVAAPSPGPAEDATPEPPPVPGDLAQTDAPFVEPEPPSQPTAASRPAPEVPQAVSQAPDSSGPPIPLPELEAPPAPAPEAPPAGTPAPGPVARAQFTSGISRREPIDLLGPRILAPRDQALSVFYFTDIRGMTGHTVTHRWVYEGQTMAEVRFRIGGGRWRVYSSKVLPARMTGRWEVVVTDEDGRVLKTDGFVFAPDGDGVS